MAVLLHRRSQERHPLVSEHLIGRGTTCQLRLDSLLVSITHAQLRWNGEGWELRDLNSRNGTFVDGQRLAGGERCPVAAGAELAFGDAEDVFELVEDGPPEAHAVSARGFRQDAQAWQMLVLPDTDNPVYTIFEQRGQWLVEDAEGEQRAIADGASLPIGEDVWIVHLPLVRDPTWQSNVVRLLLRDVTLRFLVSRDQEHISLTLDHTVGAIDLSPRVHMEALLRLAEVRLQARSERAAEQAEEGWLYVSELLGRLGHQDDANSRNLLCQHVFLARQQLADAGIVDAVDLVQRRNTIASEKSRRAGQIRIGTARIEIEKC